MSLVRCPGSHSCQGRSRPPVCERGLSLLPACRSWAPRGQHRVAAQHGDRPRYAGASFRTSHFPGWRRGGTRREATPQGTHRGLESARGRHRSEQPALPLNSIWSSHRAPTTQEISTPPLPLPIHTQLWVLPGTTVWHRGSGCLSADLLGSVQGGPLGGAGPGTQEGQTAALPQDGHKVFVSLISWTLFLFPALFQGSGLGTRLCL